MDESPVSPCIGVCELDHNDICGGCLRNRDEITAWFTASDPEKKKILESVAKRMSNEPNLVA